MKFNKKERCSNFIYIFFLDLYPPPPPLQTSTTLTPTKSKRPLNTKGQTEDPMFCKPFANNMCLEVDEYPRYY